MHIHILTLLTTKKIKLLEVSLTSTISHNYTLYYNYFILFTHGAYTEINFSQA